ncbi:hypothetical protein FQN57_003782, partial [Myotisia sp. PD_48]
HLPLFRFLEKQFEESSPDTQALSQGDCYRNYETMASDEVENPRQEEQTPFPQTMNTPAPETPNFPWVLSAASS